jgi:FkbM family methyltransferase
MVTNTKTLFVSILKSLRSDCVCDIGSRDGIQALLFRHVLPNAAVIAFEANPINFRMMQANPQFEASNIQLLPYAMTNTEGFAKFNITDVDYSDPKQNRGTSSLLVHEGLKIRETVEVPTRRIDDFLLHEYSGARRVGLWIDAEGSEYTVLQGLEQIKDRVIVVHVETAHVPLFRSQRTYAEVAALMQSYGFTPIGSNIGKTNTWGDVVFLNQRFVTSLGWRYFICKAKACISNVIQVDHAAVFLKESFPSAYTLLRRLYVKLWT